MAVFGFIKCQRRDYTIFPIKYNKNPHKVEKINKIRYNRLTHRNIDRLQAGQYFYEGSKLT